MLSCVITRNFVSNAFVNGCTLFCDVLYQIWMFLLVQVRFLNSVIVDLRSKNASLQEQLDTLMLSTDDADLYDLDVNGDLTSVPLTVSKNLPLIAWIFDKIQFLSQCIFLFVNKTRISKRSFLWHIWLPSMYWNSENVYSIITGPWKSLNFFSFSRSGKSFTTNKVICSACPEFVC